MKCRLLYILLLLAYRLPVQAQAAAWLKGTWYGETHFTNGPLATRVIVRMKMLEIKGNTFKAQYANMYPNDTTVRLERMLTGKIVNQRLVITKSVETYLLDPRTRSFWKDCSQCSTLSGFSLQGEDLVLKSIVKGCGNACDGETVFSRKMYDYDSATQAKVYKLFSGPGKTSAFKVFKKPEETEAKNIADSSSNTTVFTLAIPKDSSFTALNEKQKLSHLNTVASGVVRKKLPGNKNELQLTGSTDSLTQKEKKQIINTAIAGSEKQAGKAKNNLVALRVTHKDTIAKTPLVKTKKIPAATTKAMSAQSSSANKKTGAKDSTYANTFTKTIKDTAAVAYTKNDDYKAFKERANNLVKTCQVDVPDILITLYDNAEIDGDVVSVFHNGRLVIDNQTLSRKPLVYRIKANSTQRHHEFVLVADNLGLTPPNTALMRIAAGTQKYELVAEADMTQNAKIEIDYTGQ